MIVTITMIFYYILGKFMSLGFLSFIANLFLLILIKNNIFGSKIKNLFEDIPKKKINVIFFFIQYFLFVYFLFFLVRYNLTTIYLDTVRVNVTINGVEANITGDILDTAKEVFVDTAVFLGSARLAYLIISKNNRLNTLSKIGIVLSIASGGFTSYHILKNNTTILGEKPELVLKDNLKLDNVVISTTGNYNIPEHPILSLLFGMNAGVNYNNVKQSFTTINRNGKTILQGEGNGVINTLNYQNLN
jgi:hypothetical protein